MSLSNSRLSYSDCYDLLDRAIEEPRGIRVEVPDLNAAVYLRMRIHHARTINRQENARIYKDPSEPLHGRSPYDVFVVRVEEANGLAWVYLDKQKVEIGRIEVIPEGYQIEHEPMKMIEGPKVEAVAEAVPEPNPKVMIRRR